MIMVSCSHHDKATLYYNQSFDDIYAYANKLGLNYCIVMLDSTQDLSKQYETKLKNEFLSESFICNLVDINDSANEWYVKWLCPTSLPLTCVFFFDGTLIDIIPGATKESLLYTKDALEKGVRTNFHFANRFNKKKKHLIPLYNQILKCNMDLKQGVFTNLGNSVIDSLKYPYPYYLSILGNLINYDTVSARSIAEKMIQLENPYYLSLYKDEFIVAKRVINPNFDIHNEANIRVSEANIKLFNHKLGEIVPFEITIYNDGGQSLEISKIFKSCTCLELETSDNFRISPKDSAKINFIFKAEEEGDVFREIFIISNAINSPMLYVKLFANIITNN
ncbi:MAG: DUF1573 domain-containing protein [Bacteroidaceae bacterium]|nr:DUF1573 domain-containing protein [Bacteroidaceae bacterium]